jgi:acyl-coenzyme A thioesterase PaaI-like protein
MDTTTEHPPPDTPLFRLLDPSQPPHGGDKGEKGEKGDAVLPTPASGSPWSHGALHGGPPCGLLARALEKAVGAANPNLRPARLTVDLFRAVPMAELTVRAELVRAGRRLTLARATLTAQGRAVSQATGLFLAPSQVPDYPDSDRVLPPPNDLESVPMISDKLRHKVPPGFHFQVEVRWLESSVHPVAWIRMPMPLIEGEVLSPFQRAGALMDFSNALASRGRFKGQPQQVGFINTDSTLYLSRIPEGEWIGFHCDRVADVAGVGTSESVVFDQRGIVGRSVQARLANDDPPGLR